MRHIRAPALLLVLASVALAAIGCGGGDEGTSSTESTSTTAAQSTSTTEATSTTAGADEYAAGVSGILRPVSTQLAKDGQDATEAGTIKEITDALDNAEFTLANAVQDLQALQPPEQVADLHQDLINELQTYGLSSAHASSLLSSGASKAEVNAELQKFLDDSKTFSSGIGDLTKQFSDAGVGFSAQP